MSAYAALLLSVLVLAALLCGLVGLIVVRRAARLGADRRWAAAEAVVRPRVAAVLADVPDRDEPPARRRARHRLQAVPAGREPAGTAPLGPAATIGTVRAGRDPAVPVDRGDAAAVVAGGDADAADRAAERLVRLWAGSTRRRRRVLEAVAFGYLAKVRGPARRSLVAFLARTGTVARARRRVRRPGLVGRARAAEVLGRVGGAEAELIRLLQDRQPVVRVVAAAGLGAGAPSPAVVRALLAGVDGDRPLPPAQVTEALVRLGPDAAPLIAAALTPAALAAGGTAGPAAAAEALGLLGTPASAHLLVSALREPAAGPELRIRAARALGRIGLPAALGPLADCLDPAAAPALRAVAARALGDLGSPAAVPHLVPLLAGPHRLATNAASALVRLGPAGAAALAEVAAVDPGSAPARYATAALVTGDLARSGSAASVVPTLAG